MKNMKISAKLISSFVIVAILAAVVGAVGIIGMTQITAADTELYEVQTKPLPDIAKTLEYSQRLRIQLRNAIIYAGNAEKLQKIESDMNANMKDFEGYAAAYSAAIVNPTARTLFDEAMNLFETAYKPGAQQILEGAKNGEAQANLVAIMEDIGPATNTMVDNFTECMNIKVTAAASASASNDQLAMTMLILIIIVIVVAVAIAMVLAFYISSLISRPVITLTAFMKKAGSTGDITLSKEDEESIGKYAKVKDEIGQCIDSCAKFVSRLQDVAGALGTVAGGDLTAELALLSERDVMGLSLQKMVKNLNEMFGEINRSTDQVSTGAKQIADGAQSLAQGSTEQAAAVEELSSSISEVAKKTRDNAEMADQAAKLAGNIKQSAEKGSQQMDQMMSAVREINQASQSINKVIKVIDDIAFQTNILALNAAVEAARAGQHGKGFAVVAEEVRSLAGKSAEAAKDTGGLIANSMEKAELGARIADETAASLVEIVEGINESNKIVVEIAHSSEEQSSAITQINIGIDQVAQVVQQNSATAEESASASQEMSSQSSLLQELISQFKLKDSDNQRRSLPSSGLGRQFDTSEEKSSYSSDNGGFGKY